MEKFIPAYTINALRTKYFRIYECESRTIVNLLRYYLPAIYM